MSRALLRNREDLTDARVVVSYLGYGSTGIIAAYQERIPPSAMSPRCG